MTGRRLQGHLNDSNEMTQHTDSKGGRLLRRSVTLRNELDQMSRLSAFVDRLSELACLDEQTRSQIDLALDELVANVVSYAYPESQPGKVRIEARLRGRMLTLVLTDRGRPFDPTAVEEPDITLDVEDRPIGGLGIFLVRQVMDDVQYRRRDDKNVLTLRKQL